MFFLRLRAANCRLDTSSEALEASGVRTKPTKKGGTPVTLRKEAGGKEGREGISVWGLGWSSHLLR
jgi:hypothetical protein